MACTEVYVIKVRHAPPPRSQLLPSERRYSAQGVLGLGCIHLTLACLATILATVRAQALGRIFWPFVFVPISATVTGVTGLLAWRRWYEGIHIKIFLATSCASFLVSIIVVLGDVITTASFQEAAELHAILTSVAELVWSAVSALVAMRGVCNKVDGDDSPLPTTPLANPWVHSLGNESEKRVLEYLREHSRPPVEGKEKGGEDVIVENS